MNRSKSILLLAILGAAIFESAAGRTRTEAEMAASAISILRQQNAGQQMAPGAVSAELIERQSAVALYKVNGRIAVVSTDDLLPEVLGYTDAPLQGNEINPNMKSWLNAVNEIGKEIVAKGTPRRVVLPSSNYEPSIDALCTTHWDQDAPYNNMCPTGTESGSSWQGYESTGTCVTGCVATAMAQVLRYNCAPVKPQGTHSVSVRQQGGGYQTYTINYDEEPEYDWDHMLDSYKYGYSQQEADAVARLMYHCGVATDMEYATDGSGAYMTDCRNGLERNFGFTGAVLLDRNDYSETQWMEYVYTEINNNRPIIYAGDDMTYRVGHCFVLDGYDTRGYVHINWGWGENSGDGCFDISLLNVSGYSFKWYQEMVIGVEGDGSHRGFYNVKYDLETPGALADVLSTEIIPLDSISSLAVSGPINDADIIAIRNLGRMNVLRKLDLQHAEVAALPDSAFALCTTLGSVTLPRSVTAFGKRAFAGCSSLSTLKLYARELATLGTGVFDGVNQANARLQVPAGTSTRYTRTLQWKKFGHINEFGCALVVRNQARYVGEPNPELTYTVVGERDVDDKGVPELSCEATIDSPAGTYPILITAGTVTAPNVDLVDGYLVITERNGSGIESLLNESSDAEIFNALGQRVGAHDKGLMISGKQKFIVR